MKESMNEWLKSSQNLTRLNEYINKYIFRPDEDFSGETIFQLFGDIHSTLGW